MRTGVEAVVVVDVVRGRMGDAHVESKRSSTKSGVTRRLNVGIGTKWVSMGKLTMERNSGGDT